MASKNNKTIAVIGGGRWGHVTLKELASIDLPYENIVFVTRHNSASMQDLANKLKASDKPNIVHCYNLDDLLANYNVAAAIVVNNAEQHFVSAMRLIENNIDILIEKPIVLNIEDANTLLTAATRNKVVIIPGLNYSYLSFLQTFRKLLIGSGKRPKSFALEWGDQAGVFKYFSEMQTFSKNTTLADDEMSHIWAILNTVFDVVDIEINSCSIQKSGKYVDYMITCGNISGNVILDGAAPQRKRVLEIILEDSESISIDFTHEPGEINYKNEFFNADPDWGTRKRPLIQEYEYFLSQCGKRVISEKDITAILKSVALTEQATKWLQLSLQAASN
jgi:predicted dehydrogenase